MAGGAKRLDPSTNVTVEDVDLVSLPFDFMPVSFDIYGAAEPDTMAYLDTFAKRIASRSTTSMGYARRRLFQQVSHSTWT